MLVVVTPLDGGEHDVAMIIISFKEASFMIADEDNNALAIFLLPLCLYTFMEGANLQ